MPKKEKTEVVNDKIEQRPWGWFETVCEGEKYKVKRLFIKRGQRISLQSHDNRDEHWVKDMLLIEVDDSERHIGLGGHILIPKKQKHRLTAVKDMLLIEVQMGICEEKDIRRYQDDYGRV